MHKSRKSFWYLYMPLESSMIVCLADLHVLGSSNAGHNCKQSATSSIKKVIVGAGTPERVSLEAILPRRQVNVFSQCYQIPETSIKLRLNSGVMIAGLES